MQGSPGASASRQRPAGALAALGTFAILAVATQGLVWPTAPASAAVPLATLGQQLVTTLVLPFEVVSLVFVAAMVGAIAVATGRRGPKG